MRARVAARQQKFSAELSALDAARDAVRSALDPDWLARFDRVAASRGTGIALAVNQQCTGCRMGVRPQMWNQLREGELLSCDSCNRLLYWDPALAPAAKAPQPEVAEGAGRGPAQTARGRRVGLANMMRAIRASVTDNPTYVLSIAIDGHKKQVVDYVGQWVGMPAAIVELEDDVDALAHTERWIKGPRQQ